ncbi:MAG: ATP-grasp domain-containing protein [Desulfuromonadaceae bacterium]|nr:ATP-grasp domain-containing protein [Desulfuromonadaceae bacterium]
MILVDKPYLSDFLKQTLADHKLPVIATAVSAEMGLPANTTLVTENDAVTRLTGADATKIYTVSENSIGWIAEYLKGTELPEKVSLFKNKATFRSLIQPLYPDFFFQEIAADQLDSLNFASLPKPFIIKPTVGFFSMGVHKVHTLEEWEDTKAAICAELQQGAELYPEAVLNSASMILEECIEGDEFAVDAYFDSNGEPVITNILHHIFSSESDVSDRVYLSSKKIIEENLLPFTAFLNSIGELAQIRNFPMHVEVRRTAAGTICPIEINPLRFGGWCTTADMTWFAYGFNPYLYYFQQQRPNWNEILKQKQDKLYSVIVLDNSSGIEGEQIASFDYAALLAGFAKPLELRRIDYREYPVFGFLFAETDVNDQSELEYILKSDLREYVTPIG